MDRIHPRRTDSSKARQLSSISDNALRRICEQHVPEPLECDNTDKTVALQSSCGFDGFDEHSTLSLAVHWPARNSCSWFFCMSLSLLSLSFAQAIQIQVFGVLGYEWSLGYGYKNGFASLQKHTLSRFAYLSTMSNHVFSRYGYTVFVGPTKHHPFCYISEIERGVA